MGLRNRQLEFQFPCLSVLALSSRFDGAVPRSSTAAPAPLSVLALSSRFDGVPVDGGEYVGPRLSVLALSSRFDGGTG